MKSVTRDLGGGMGSGGAWNEPCPACSKGAAAVASPPATTLCGNGHVWSNHFGDDWSPDDGALCDCGTKRWHTVLAASPPATAEIFRDAIRRASPSAANRPRSRETDETLLADLAHDVATLVADAEGMASPPETEPALITEECGCATCPIHVKQYEALAEEYRTLSEAYALLLVAHGSRHAGTKEDV